jgi:hypothetical protein
MKMRKIIAAALACMVLLASCSTSIVLTNTSKPYDIYVNNRLKGQGRASIPRTGLPQSKNIMVKDAAGNVLAQQKIKRDLNLLKFVGGFFTYFTLWIVAWDYDPVVEIFIPKQSSEDWDKHDGNDKDKPTKSKWD